MKLLNLGNIDTYILLGGGGLMVRVIAELQKRKKKIIIFSGKRHLDEIIDNFTLRDFLVKQKGIVWHESADINIDARINQYLAKSALAITFGPSWDLEPDFINKFKGRLFNLNPIRLPEFRGGAHFSWQIMMSDKQGASVIEQWGKIISTGKIITKKLFNFGTRAKIPRDFIDISNKHSLLLFKEFFDRIERQRDFQLIAQDENKSIYFPRLYTPAHGYIDWSWEGKDVYLFICAFDEPYKGASTFIDNQKVFLKGCVYRKSKKNIHPFQSGLIFRLGRRKLFVAAQHGILEISRVDDERDKNIIDDLRLGDRFYTPRSCLDEALSFSAIYDSKGIKSTSK